MFGISFTRTATDERPRIVVSLADAAEAYKRTANLRALNDARQRLAEYDQQTRELSARADDVQDRLAGLRDSHEYQEEANALSTEWKQLCGQFQDRCRWRVEPERQVKAAEYAARSGLREHLEAVARKFIAPLGPDPLPSEKERHEYDEQLAAREINVLCAAFPPAPVVPVVAILPGTVLEFTGPASVRTDSGKQLPFAKGERVEARTIGLTASRRLLDARSARIVAELHPIRDDEPEAEAPYDPEPEPIITPDTVLTLSEKAIEYTGRNPITGKQWRFRRGQTFTPADTGNAPGIAAAMRAGVVIVAR
jgi:hypothetical protein